MSEAPPPEDVVALFERRDPRAGQGLAEHCIGLTLYTKVHPSRFWRVAVPLPVVATIIRPAGGGRRYSWPLAVGGG
jgi:hypothetical protein